MLVRSRNHLPLLLAGLREANIKYQALEIDRLSDLSEIIDILALTRAICHQGGPDCMAGIVTWSMGWLNVARAAPNSQK